MVEKELFGIEDYPQNVFERLPAGLERGEGHAIDAVAGLCEVGESDLHLGGFRLAGVCGQVKFTQDLSIRAGICGPEGWSSLIGCEFLLDVLGV